MAEVITTVGGIPLTEENYLALRKAYHEAKAKGQENLTFLNREWHTSFVKYVLELMESYPIIKPLIDIPDDEV